MSLRSLVDHPPATHDIRPEQSDLRPGALEKAIRGLSSPFERRIRVRAARLERIVPAVNALAGEMGGIHDNRVGETARNLGMELRRKGFEIDLVARAFALIREVAGRTIGMRHFDVQLMGGWALLQGMVAEMETGEGKTLTATLAAGTAALAGVPVHVLTVNDYLTARDAEEMGPVYRALGLSVGCVIHDVPPGARRCEYSSDVTYCTNKEIVFDYLRDKLELAELANAPLRLQAEPLLGKGGRSNRLLLRGLCYAIADEADSLLIDESRTPLIIAGSVAGGHEIDYLRAILTFAGSLKEGEDFIADLTERTIRITENGQRSIDTANLLVESKWTASIRKNELTRRALSALYLYRLDHDYLVRDGKIEIIDAYTGRAMPDRSWEQGLHQLVEIKEGCRVTEQQETVAKISFQKFFRRYLHLAGMTGTGSEVAGELLAIYGLPVVRIATNRPARRMVLPGKIYPDLAGKWRALLERVRSVHATGQPVLVGTASVVTSETVSRLFTEAGLVHRVLNAKNDREEAEIVAMAGRRGAITIATNMAGRGTDIKLAPGVAELNGLYVILTERHDAARIDRQLAGRCARQGDPGSYEEFLSLEDPLLDGGKGGIWQRLAQRLPVQETSLWCSLAGHAIIHAQKRTERLHARIRRELFRQDVQTRRRLSFSRPEN